eukprot:3542234-Pyramimonas_sp.AAC.1
MASAAATADDSSKTFLITAAGAPCRLRWSVYSSSSSRNLSADSCEEALPEALGLPSHEPRLAEDSVCCAEGWPG